MRLKNKVALITGAARGIGRSIAINFAQQGCDLILLDVGQDIAGVSYSLGSENQLEHTAMLCRDLDVGVLSGLADVRDVEQIELIVTEGLARFGKIDVLVNNAGIATPSGKIVHDIEESDWQLMLDVDLNGVWRMTKSVGRIMSQQRSGSIINIASTAGLVGYRYFSAYVAAKHGVIGLTKASALDYAPLKIRVNAICPGSVRDDDVLEGKMLVEIAKAIKVNEQNHESLFVESHPLNELVECSDIANAAIWLASDDAVRVTGSVTTIDAGFTVK